MGCLVYESWWHLRMPRGHLQIGVWRPGGERLLRGLCAALPLSPPEPVSWAACGHTYWRRGQRVNTTLSNGPGLGRKVGSPCGTYVLGVTWETHSNGVILAHCHCRRLNKLENLFLVCPWLALWHGQTPSLLFDLVVLFVQKRKNSMCLKSTLKFLWKQVSKYKVLLLFLSLLLVFW